MKIKDLIGGSVGALLCLLVGVIGSFSTAANIPNWYAFLNKPFFTPPNWLFGPAWTLLYILMGIAAYLIWKDGLDKKANQQALGIFAAQLFFNAIWTPIFFGWHQLFIAFIVIVVLWCFILWTIIRFSRISNIAGWLLAPYILWVTFASALNFGVWWLNR
ncbi:MAG: TspO/MBR family protein [bacterium]